MRARTALTATALAAATVAYTRRLQSPARRNWSPPEGRNVTTSTLAARINGDDGSPIVLLHGLVASGIYWGAAYDTLAQHHRLIVPDLVGFGRSPRPTSGYGPDDHVGALLTCLDELGATAPATIGAHSLGTLIAIRLAATHPDRVHSVVAFGPPVYPDRHSALGHVGATSPMARLFVLPGRTAEIACRWVCNHHNLAVRLAVLTHPGLPPPIARDALQHTWESYSETLERGILASAAPTWLPDVHCPLRLIAGDHDPVVDPDYLAQVPSLAPHATVETWAGGHDLPLARPTDCVAALEQATAQALSVC